MIEGIFCARQFQYYRSLAGAGFAWNLLQLLFNPFMSLCYMLSTSYRRPSAACNQSKSGRVVKKRGEGAQRIGNATSRTVSQTDGIGNDAFDRIASNRRIRHAHLASVPPSHTSFNRLGSMPCSSIITLTSSFFAVVFLVTFAFISPIFLR